MVIFIHKSYFWFEFEIKYGFHFKNEIDISLVEGKLKLKLQT